MSVMTKEKKPVREIKSKRTACTKVFENDDHSFTAALYGTQVHYRNAAGTYEEISHRLTEKQNEFIDETTSVTMHFSKTSGEKKMISVKSGGYTLDWGYEGCTEVRARKIDLHTETSAAETEGNTEAGVLETYRGPSRDDKRKNYAVVTNDYSIRYPLLYPGMELRYTPAGLDMKEDIVLWERTGETMVILYRANGLTALKKNGAVVFADRTGSEVFTVRTPVMTDAAGAHSLDVRLELEEGKAAHSWRVTLAPDREWLADEARVYPVVIDPVVKTSQSYRDIADAHVSSWYSGDNYKDCYILKTGFVDGSTLRSYLKFTLPDLDNASEMVTDASFFIGNFFTDTKKRRVNVHKVTKSWSDTNITWNNKPSFDASVVDYCEYTADKTSMREFDITDLVKDWYLNGNNYGLMIRDNEETANYMEYLSADCNVGYIENRPYIMISYVSYAGLEDQWTYHSQNLRMAGKAWVNDYNGNMVFIHPLVSMTGIKMPVDLKLVFNSSARKASTYCGLGFRLNYQQTMKSVTLGGTQYYQHTDADGTAHYYIYDSTKKQWVNEMNSDSILIIGTDSASKYTIKDKKDNKTIFSSSGQLVKVQDANGSTLTVTYTSGKITKLTDGAGRNVLLAYNGSSQLTTVTDPAGRAMTFGYDSNGRMNGITEVDGYKSTLAYDGNGNMTAITDPFGYKVQYTYDSRAPYRVRSIQEYAGSTAGQKLSIAYGYNKTKFTDLKGRSQYYLFNNNGETVSLRNDEGYAAAFKYMDQDRMYDRLSQTSSLQYVPVNLLVDTFTGFAAWKKTEETGCTLSVSTDVSGCYLGSQSLKVQSPGTTGRGAWTQTVSVIPGKDYVFSAYMRQAQTAAAADAFLGLEAVSGTVSAQSRDHSGAAGEWRRMEVVLPVPASTAAKVSVSVSLAVRGIAGAVYFDCIQLEEGRTASRFNLIRNSNFTDSWNGFRGTNTDTKDCVVKTGSPGQTAEVLTATLRLAADMRKGPGSAFAAVKSYPKGTAGTVIGVDYDSGNNKWYILRTETSATGYFLHSALSLNGSDRNVTTTAIAGGNDLNIRKAAGTGNPAVTQVSRGQVMTVNGAAYAGGVKWYRVSLVKDGTEYSGYVSCEYVAVSYPSQEKVKVSTDVLNVRVGPGTSFARSAQLVQNAQVTATAKTVLANGDEWLYISFTYNGAPAVGYVSADYMTFVSRTAAPAIPVQELVIVPEGNGPLGDQVFRINGVETKIKRMKQILTLPGKKGDAYVANAWSMASSVPLSGDRHFGMLVVFRTASGGGKENFSEFGADSTDWQFLTDVFIAPEDYASIEVSFCYDYNANPSYFTGIGFYREQFGASYVYDSEGNVISVIDKDKKASAFEYDSSNNISKMIDVKGNSFDCTHDARHNLTGAVSAEKTTYAFTYGSAGNVMTSRLVNASDTSKAVTASAGYSADSNYMTSLTDDSGHTATYAWNTLRGEMTSLTDAAGSVTAYSHDQRGRLTGVSSVAEVQGVPTPVDVAYGYTKDRLTSITHNGFDYTIAHDIFGNNTAVNIAGVQAVGYTYHEKNGLLERTTYANGWDVAYTYDSMDRVAEITVPEGTGRMTLCRYVYDKQNRLRQMIEGGTQACTWSYDYDLVDRVRRAVCDNGEERSYTYDDNNNLTSMTAICNGNTQTTVYTYDKDDRETSTMDGTVSVTRTYDAYGRRWTVKRGGDKSTTTYNYGEKADGQPMNRLASIDNNGNSIAYTYDAVGNIRTITDGSGTTAYHYDGLSRLVREDNAYLGQTLTYIRDGGGNVLEKRCYALTSAADLTGKTYTAEAFTYSSTWKDQLTAVDGQALTYDAAGSLLSYKGRQYSWCMGSILTGIRGTAPGDDFEIGYVVNARGVRTEKRRGTALLSKFYLEGTRILAEQTGSDFLQYIYNSSGELTALRYRQGVYYYVRNAQSDIIGITDADGSMVVTYSYDTWGKVLSVGGSMADTLGAVNPFRYRGYYYDTETGFYYLNSRYYDPGLERMLSADSTAVVGMTPASLDDKNLYNYCDGNPVGRIDADGDFWMAAASFVLGAGFGVVSALCSSDPSVEDCVVSGIMGGLSALTMGGLAEVAAVSNVAEIVVDSAVTVINTGLSAAVAWEQTDGSTGDKAKAAIAAGTSAAISTIGGFLIGRLGAGIYSSFTIEGVADMTLSTVVPGVIGNICSGPASRICNVGNSGQSKPQSSSGREKNKKQNIYPGIYVYKNPPKVNIPKMSELPFNRLLWGK